MTESNELQRLESFVTRLLGEFDDVRKEKEQLQKELSEKNNVITELNEQLASQEIEREEISQRVGRILSQFENWEKDVVVEGAKETDEQQVEEEIAEAEKQVQEHELFGAVPGYRQD